MRLFLAIDLPPAVRDALAALQGRLRPSCAGWRWVRAEALHLTVRFLGEVSPEARERERDRWRAAAAGGEPLGLRFAGLGTFPPRGRPRILWVGIVEERAGALTGLATRVEAAAVALGYEPERRSFRPHLTLARAARGTRAEAPPAEAGLEGVRFDTAELVLFRSRLGPGGARYERLESFSLG